MNPSRGVRITVEMRWSMLLTIVLCSPTAVFAQPPVLIADPRGKMLRLSPTKMFTGPLIIDGTGVTPPDDCSRSDPKAMDASNTFIQDPQSGAVGDYPNTGYGIAYNRAMEQAGLRAGDPAYACLTLQGRQTCAWGQFYDRRGKDAVGIEVTPAMAMGLGLVIGVDIRCRAHLGYYPVNDKLLVTVVGIPGGGAAWGDRGGSVFTYKRTFHLGQVPPEDQIDFFHEWMPFGP